MELVDTLRKKARQLKSETYALNLAAHHPATPWHAKVLVAAVVAYAFSPIDLIPDFIPVLGYLDDLIIVPIGIAIAVRMIPAGVMAECRKQAAESSARPTSWVAAGLIVALWVLLAALCALWAYEAFAYSPNTAFHSRITAARSSGISSGARRTVSSSFSAARWMRWRIAR